MDSQDFTDNEQAAAQDAIEAAGDGIVPVDIVPDETAFEDPDIETVMADVAEFDPDEQPAGAQPYMDEYDKTTLDKMIDAGTVASHVVALGATKFADAAGPVIARGVEMAAPVVEKGARQTAKGAVKLGAIGLRSLGKGLSALGGYLKSSAKKDGEEPAQETKSEYVVVPSGELPASEDEVAELPASEDEAAELPAPADEMAMEGPAEADA